MGVVAGTLYASPSDFNALGLPAKASAVSIPPPSLAEALQAASDELSSYLQAQYTLPLLQWDTSLTWHTCQVATYIALVVRGLAPATTDLELVKSNYRMALDWVRRIQAGWRPATWIDSSPGGFTPQTYVASNLPRGWYPPTSNRNGGGFGR